MLNNYFIPFLILSFINLTGCFYSAVMSKEEIDMGIHQLDFKDELFCTTKDYTRYHFLPGNYTIGSDSLYGKGAIESSLPIAPFQGNIAVVDIISFEQKRVDTGATIGFIAGIILVGIIVYSAMLGSAINESFNPD